MKRGFLKSAKAKACPLGPELAPKPPASSKTSSRVTAADPEIPVPEDHKERAPSERSIPNVEKRKTTRTRHTMSPEGVMCTTLPSGAGPGEPVSECLFFPGCKDALLSLPGFPQPLRHHATPAFRIGATPGEGTRLFSTRALKMGDLILSERPLFVAARVPYTPDVEKYFQLSVSRMRPEARSAFMALAVSPTADGAGPVIGIVRAHGLTLDGLWVSGKLKDQTYRAVCKDISRLSHNDSPNTAPSFNLRSFSFRLFALRDIAAGEELTADTYLDCPAPKPWKGPILLELSLRLWLRDPTLPDDWLIAKCHEQLEVARLSIIARLTEITPKDLTYEDLRLQIKAVEMLMQSYICLGDAHGASKWAAKLNRIGVDDDEIKALLDPASAAYPAHSFWRHRVDRELGKGIGQPILIQSTIMFPMEWWH
ncbi:hypothetical protein C8R44DRAFT_991296 [Mycena epipterygia]|nr:hypothetical protein C8R44DRAFT_991296 [Mycena epipterygia]